MKKIDIPRVITEGIFREVLFTGGEKQVKAALPGIGEQFADVIAEERFAAFETRHEYGRTREVAENCLDVLGRQIGDRIKLDITETAAEMAARRQFEGGVKGKNGLAPERVVQQAFDGGNIRSEGKFPHRLKMADW